MSAARANIALVRTPVGAAQLSRLRSEILALPPIECLLIAASYCSSLQRLSSAIFVY